MEIEEKQKIILKKCLDIILIRNINHRSYIDLIE